MRRAPGPTATREPGSSQSCSRGWSARPGRGAAPGRQGGRGAPVAVVDPVARVLVDLPLAHLDRPFDYGVPESMAEDAQPGVRVKVRFAGRDVDGYVVERAREHRPRRSADPAAPGGQPRAGAVAAGGRARRGLAERYAGTRSDVLRLAVPSRHAATEKQESVAAAPTRRPTTRRGRGGLGRPRARAGVPPAPGRRRRRRARSGAPRPAPTGRPSSRTPRRRPSRPAAVRWSCVPDGKDVARVDAALTAVLGAGQHVVLTADAGPAKRYRDFLAVSRGRRRVVVGTRAAAFAPVARPRPGRDLGRRRRPARRAAGAVPARPRGAAAARRARGRGGAGRRVRAQRRGPAAAPHAAGRTQLAPPARSCASPGHGHRRRRRRARAGPRPPRPGRPAADRGAPR